MCVWETLENWAGNGYPLLCLLQQLSTRIRSKNRSFPGQHVAVILPRHSNATLELSSATPITYPCKGKVPKASNFLEESASPHTSYPRPKITSFDLNRHHHQPPLLKSPSPISTTPLLVDPIPTTHQEHPPSLSSASTFPARLPSTPRAILLHKKRNLSSATYATPPYLSPLSAETNTPFHNLCELRKPSEVGNSLPPHAPPYFPPPPRHTPQKPKSITPPSPSPCYPNPNPSPITQHLKPPPQERTSLTSIPPSTSPSSSRSIARQDHSRPTPHIAPPPPLPLDHLCITSDLAFVPASQNTHPFHPLPSSSR